MLPKMYNSRMDVESDFVPQFTDWCKRRHWPDVVGVGFYSAHGYHSVEGGPWICNFYEIPGVEIFGDAYDGVRASDDELAVIVAEKISNHSLTIYDQVATANIPEDVHDDTERPSLVGALDAPVVTTLRFATDEREALLSWYRDVEFPRLQRTSGFLRGRVLESDGPHPVYPTNQPDWAVMLEWASLSTAQADGDEAAVVARHDEAVSDLDRTAYNLLRHEYSLRHAEAWVP